MTSPLEDNAQTGEEKASNRPRPARTLLIATFVVVVFVSIIVGVSIGLRDSDEDISEAPVVSTDMSPTPAPSNLRGGDQPSSGTVFYTTNEDQVEAFLADPEFVDKQFYMINIAGYREMAVYKDGRETDLTGYEANQIYGDYVLPELQRIGAEIVFSANVQWNFGQETPYTDVTIVRYPNTVAFQTMTMNPTFEEYVAHKEAGLEHNFVMACDIQDLPYLAPMENPPFPPNETNPETAMMNIVDYREQALYQEGDADADNNRTGREAYAMYSDNAGPITTSYGVRNLARFDVKAVFNGEIGFEEIRLNYFPSDENWHQVIDNEERQSYSHHRYAGMEEKSKSFKVMPITLNKFFQEVEDDGCDLCGDGGVISNLNGTVTFPDGSSIACSELASAVTNGLIPPEQCPSIAPYVPDACNCTATTTSDTETPPGGTACIACEAGFVNTDAVVTLPTGDSVPCSQLEIAFSSGMISTEVCSTLVDLARETCGCA